MLNDVSSKASGLPVLSFSKILKKALLASLPGSSLCPSSWQCPNVGQRQATAHRWQVITRGRLGHRLLLSAVNCDLSIEVLVGNDVKELCRNIALGTQDLRNLDQARRQTDSPGD